MTLDCLVKCPDCQGRPVFVGRLGHLTMCRRCEGDGVIINEFWGQEGPAGGIPDSLRCPERAGGRPRHLTPPTPPSGEAHTAGALVPGPGSRPSFEMYGWEIMLFVALGIVAFASPWLVFEMLGVAR